MIWLMYQPLLLVSHRCDHKVFKRESQHIQKMYGFDTDLYLKTLSDLHPHDLEHDLGIIGFTTPLLKLLWMERHLVRFLQQEEDDRH